MTPTFEESVKRALFRTGFGVAPVNECGVLLFDSAAWLPSASAAHGYLDAREGLRANRFRFERDRTTYVLAHACWRIALGVSLGMETAQVPLLIAASGQPTLPGTGMATSLSHSGSWVAIAIGNVVTIGVDIESTPTRGALATLVNELCTPAEKTYLETLPPSVHEDAMLALWTRKEALLKAFGIGLLAEPSSVQADPDAVVSPPPSAPMQVPCQVRNICLPDNLAGALARPAGTAGRCGLYSLPCS